MNKKIKVNESQKLEMIDKVKKYFKEERNESLGDLAADLVLDFFIKELAPNIYNQGVEDSYAYIRDSTEDILALKIFRR